MGAGGCGSQLCELPLFGWKRYWLTLVVVEGKCFDGLHTEKTKRFCMADHFVNDYETAQGLLAEGNKT